MSLSLNSSYTGAVMMNRFALTQVYPELPIRLAYAALTACSMFASFRTTKGSEPPSSKHPFLTCFAHWIATLIPPRVLPVNLHARTRLSARILAHYSSLANMLMKSPASNPASSIASYIAWEHWGVPGAPLNKMVLPRTIGGRNALYGTHMGKFHGIIAVN